MRSEGRASSTAIISDRKPHAPPPMTLVTNISVIRSTTSARTVTTTVTPLTPTIDENTSDTLSTAIVTTATISNVDTLQICPPCGRTFTFYIGLVGHLQINSTETALTLSG
ncbi:unnamed protein product [Schistocephalus solidus]|uniref:C2H2-type domain-containing protein n=1 Tax=Schistocephalus solidus TaxID=70667 RepID=A0A183S9A5_SCHSO|nr:unnamed protein product [Schistocephalus solidus]